jgi:hypothetical protein
MATASLHPKSHNAQALGELVDELGLLQSDIKRLQEREKALKEILATQGEGEFAGTFFKAKVKTSERSSLDLAAVRKVLSDAVIAKLTKLTPVTTVSVRALAFVGIAA